MRILVLGAAGRTGREIVRLALKRGYMVTAFVRQAGELTESPNLKVVVGDAEDPSTVKAAFRGCDAVVSALGHTSLAESKAQTVATKAILDIMPLSSHFVSLTGFGVGDDKDPDIPISGLVMNWIIQHVPGGMYADGDRHAALLRKSSVQWTLIRAPRLTLGKKRGHYELGYFPLSATSTIDRGDVAEAMLDCLKDAQWAKKAPMIRSR